MVGEGVLPALAGAVVNYVLHEILYLYDYAMVSVEILWCMEKVCQILGPKWMINSSLCSVAVICGQSSFIWSSHLLSVLLCVLIDWCHESAWVMVSVTVEMIKPSHSSIVSNDILLHMLNHHILTPQIILHWNWDKWLMKIIMLTLIS